MKTLHVKRETKTFTRGQRPGVDYHPLLKLFSSILIHSFLHSFSLMIPLRTFDCRETCSCVFRVYRHGLFTNSGTFWKTFISKVCVNVLPSSSPHIWGHWSSVDLSEMCVCPPNNAIKFALHHLHKDTLCFATPPTLARAGTPGAKKLPNRCRSEVTDYHLMIMAL